MPDTVPPSTRRPVNRSRLIGIAVIVIVVILAAFNTKVLSIDEAEASAPETFDPIAFADENFATKIVPQIESEAVDLATLLTDLAAGADEADFGNTSGAASAYAFPVVFTAVVGTPTPPVVPLTVEGVDPATTVQLQIGPALSGTAIRDVTGTISFNEFTNQLEYQNVGTELNNQVRTLVLTGIDFTKLTGKTIMVTGAFLRVNPALVSVVPVSIEVLE